MGRPISPSKNPRSHDLIETPVELAELIVNHYAPAGRQLDPCRGASAFYTAMTQRNSGPVEWCEITEGRDFFSRYGDDEVLFDWVVTNPPWSQFRTFLRLSMSISNHVVFLGTMTHFVTRARLRDLRDYGFGLREALLVKEPGGHWPSSGFQLAAVHLERDWLGPLTFSGAV